MEGGARALILRTLTNEEYDTIDQVLREKIETILNEHIEDYITAKALFESTRGSQRTYYLLLYIDLFLKGLSHFPLLNYVALNNLLKTVNHSLTLLSSYENLKIHFSLFFILFYHIN